LLKALDENQHGLPSKRLSGTSFDFVVWKNESNQPHVSGRTLTLQLHFLLRCARRASAWWARRQSDHAMTRAGWMRRCASLMAMRRIS
jgi:hypothetical protein